ncbi:DUF6403 family protein [Actinosynnema sp. NPDC020468]|uniref:DUF6403 family protein n=1 Tax=Actinosynnema sp. NPDC020468 TaxID=3154488 RepID=UPI0033C70428
MDWLVWVVGGLVLVGAGFGAAFGPGVRAAARAREQAWVLARGAVEVAEVGRDASTAAVPRAEELLSQAQALVACGGGARVARRATGFARAAERAWREHGRG